ncbi:MAG: DNA polymerase III subunit delta [Firmicutes bacterium]|nr:DNA polymerase III subunit delta [Bacillota bacterium]
MSLVRALQEVRNKGGARLYVLYGCADAFAIRWLENELAANIASGESLIVRRHYPEDRLADALGEAFTGSLFGDAQIVSVRDIECLTTTFKGKMTDEETRALQWLVDEMPAHPVILCCKGEKLDERKKIVKALLGLAYTRAIPGHKHSPEDLRSIVRDQMKTKLKLTKSQEEYLLAQVGSSLDRLTGEMQKILTFAGERSAITDTELQGLVAHDEQSDVFAVIRLIMTGKAAQAYELYRAQSASESVFGFMALLSRQYRLIAQVQDPVNGQLPDAKLASLCGAHPFAVKVARDQARGLPLVECMNSLVELADLEFSIKSGQMSEQTAMDMFFLRRMRGA